MEPHLILEDILYAAKHFQDRDRVFLCDGDALIVPQNRLVQILLIFANIFPGQYGLVLMQTQRVSLGNLPMNSGSFVNWD